MHKDFGLLMYDDRLEPEVLALEALSIDKLVKWMVIREVLRYDAFYCYTIMTIFSSYTFQKRDLNDFIRIIIICYIKL